MPAEKLSGCESDSPSKKVKWSVEEPSYYRPEMPKDSPVENLGKEQQQFREFYDVSHMKAFGVFSKYIVVQQLNLNREVPLFLP